MTSKRAMTAEEQLSIVREAIEALQGLMNNPDVEDVLRIQIAFSLIDRLMRLEVPDDDESGG